MNEAVNYLRFGAGAALIATAVSSAILGIFELTLESIPAFLVLCLVGVGSSAVYSISR